jgi:hypothetical protein
MTHTELLASFLDNTASPENFRELGILKFGKMLFPDIFTNDFSIMHYEMALLLLEMLHPKYTRRIERQRYFNVHREASKSTIGTFLLPIYFIYLKGYSPYIKINGEVIKLPPIKEDFIVITSETSTRAEQFVNDLRGVIESRGDLSQLFGEKHPEMIETDEDDRTSSNIWRKNAFITADKTVVWALGAGQRIRGIKVAGNRPTLIIVDDMYSRVNTKTEQTREHLNYWFFSELANSTDSVRGKILWLGTMVHPETVLAKFEHSDTWSGVKRAIIDKLELFELIARWKEYGVEEVPPKDVCKGWQKDFKTLSWPDRHDLWYILHLYKDSADNNDLNYFWQEYMNEPHDPLAQDFGLDSFAETPLNIYRSNDYNMDIQYVEFMYKGIRHRGEIVLCIGVDPAVATSATADDTVIFVSGFCRVYPYIEGYDTEGLERRYKEGIVFPVIAHIEGGRYAIHDYEERKGIAEALMKLCDRYKISYVTIEAQGQQKAIVDEIRRTFYEKGYHIPIVEEYTNMKKEEKINSIAISIVQRYKVVICEPNPAVKKKLFTQLVNLGIGGHDDYPDAWSISMKMIQPPEPRIIHETRHLPPRLEEQNAKARKLEWMFR